ncbi:MAG: enoyl-CoA hydratase/isomerase family protein [Gammaproteobacteria bacterium]|nr:enoyl-CoA hydratase/isomerase family protein [Gammaproteobacteria bacterium]
MEFDTIDFERDGGVAIVALNRPDAANSLNCQMAEDLLEVATHCDSNPDIRCVVFTARGKMFSAGGDLHTFAAQGDGMSEYMRKATAGMHVAISRFARMNAPYLVAVNGIAAGAGFSMAISGDMIFAAESAKFTMAYTRAGVSPDGSSTYFLPRLVGHVKAMQLIYMNDLLTADQAKEWGLVNEVIPDDKLMERTLEVAHQLAAGPTLAYGEAKRLVSDSLSNTLETQMELETRAIAGLARASEDAVNAIHAFTKKEKATFHGR